MVCWFENEATNFATACFFDEAKNQKQYILLETVCDYQKFYSICWQYWRIASQGMIKGFFLTRRRLKVKREREWTDICDPCMSRALVWGWFNLPPLKMKIWLQPTHYLPMSKIELPLLNLIWILPPYKIKVMFATYLNWNLVGFSLTGSNPVPDKIPLKYPLPIF